MLNAITDRAVFERALTPAEQGALLATIARHAGLYARRDHAWIRLACTTGLRLGSLAGLTVHDAREAMRTKHLIVRPEIAKGRRGYTVFAGGAARQALADLLAVRTAMGLRPDPVAPLICSRKGGAPLSPRAFQQRLQVWRQAAGLQVDASPHWLRHTFAQTIRRKSTSTDPLKVVQLGLGHRSRRSTEVYTLPTRDEIAADMEEVFG